MLYVAFSSTFKRLIKLRIFYQCGKGAVDGIGAAVKYRATRKVLSGTADDAILTPEDLYKFVQKDTSINVFYLNEKRIKSNGEKYGLSNRWTRD